MTPDREATRRPTAPVNWPALAGLITLALVLRRLHVSLGISTPSRSDASGYDAAARRLMTTGSYAYPVGHDLRDHDVFRETSWDTFVQRPANVFSMPGYVGFVAAICHLSGTGPVRLFVGRMAQACLGAFTVALVLLPLSLDAGRADARGGRVGGAHPDQAGGGVDAC